MVLGLISLVSFPSFFFITEPSAYDGVAVHDTDGQPPPAISSAIETVATESSCYQMDQEPSGNFEFDGSGGNY
jgi:hypothetical protein